LFSVLYAQQKYVSCRSTILKVFKILQIARLKATILQTGGTVDVKPVSLIWQVLL
jgi:hypothetical protein